jgi:hypothetical protein
MRPRLWILLIAILAAPACSFHSNAPHSLTAEQRAAVEADVHSFMETVARDVTQRGPTVWEKHFLADPAFFMANDGRLAFPNNQAAAQGIEAFARTIKHIELRWGDDLRIDVLAPNLAVVGTSWSELQVDNADHSVNEAGFFTALVENRAGRWQFRDAHWSSIPRPKAP